MKLLEQVDLGFEYLKQSRNTNDVDLILNKIELPKKFHFDERKYPKLEFHIDHTEIETWQKEGMIIFNKEHNSFSIDPSKLVGVSKLLFATLWKNGDTQKLSHIISGVLNIDNSNEQSFVFHAFGRHLGTKGETPIVDQHVLRAIAYYEEQDPTQKENIRRINSMTKKHKRFVLDYKNWVESNLTKELKQTPNFLFHVDKVLFGLGKSIKIKTKRGHN